MGMCRPVQHARVWGRKLNIDTRSLSLRFASMRMLGLIVASLSLGACSAVCSNETVKVLRSPKGDHHAEMFMRECGATTDFTTQISVDPGYWHTIGNVFVADAYNGGKRGTWGGPWADMAWIGPDHLMVTYDDKARIFDQHKVVNGVRITYRPAAH
ncbi:MAG: hypothetical protein Q27BB25_14260 [Blastomonas sp. CACIA14H2]|nr:MAG: hypothetical protein Q27BB25_14260 [Blastomonas sp. CACIA14H2]